MTTKVKAGDLITIEKIGQNYRENDDFDALLIDSNDDVSEAVSDIRKLRGKEIFKIEKTDIHPDLAKFGVNVRHYTLKGQPIEMFAFKENGILVNGEILIPDGPGFGMKLKDRYFFNELEAQSYATVLNTGERDKMKELKGLVDKGYNMLEEIVTKAMV